MSNDQEVTIASGDALDVREFGFAQLMSTSFSVTATAVSKKVGIDPERVVGREATFTLRGRSMGGVARRWRGELSELHQVGVDEKGFTMYQVRIDKLSLALAAA